MRALHNESISSGGGANANANVTYNGSNMVSPSSQINLCSNHCVNLEFILVPDKKLLSEKTKLGRDALKLKPQQKLISALQNHTQLPAFLPQIDGLVSGHRSNAQQEESQVMQQLIQNCATAKASGDPKFIQLLTKNEPMRQLDQ